MAEVIERTCKGCGDWALCFDGYCGECAPASSVDDFIRWWHSPAGAAARVIAAEQLVSLWALEKGEQLEHETKDAGG
jgi:hypothetical protein